jgi:hypothetical protein
MFYCKKILLNMSANVVCFYIYFCVNKGDFSHNSYVINCLVVYCSTLSDFKKDKKPIRFILSAGKPNSCRGSDGDFSDCSTWKRKKTKNRSNLLICKSTNRNSWHYFVRRRVGFLNETKRIRNIT